MAAIIFAFSAASCSDTAAKADSVVMTDSSGVSVREYTTNNQTFYAQGKISNAREGTKIRFVWSYTTDSQIIDQFEYSTKQSTEVIPATLTTSGSFPAGNYKLELFVGNRKEPDAYATFKVTQLTPSIVDGCVTSFIDENGQPKDNITNVASTGTWYACAVITDTNPDTTVRFVWLNSNGKTIGEFTADPEGETDIIVSGSLPLSQTMPDGDYQVNVYIDDRTTPEMTIPFKVDSYVNIVQNADYSLFTNTENGYSIYYPSDWETDFGTGSSVSGFYPMMDASPKVNDINRIMVAAMKDSNRSIDEALEMWVWTVEDENYDDYVSILNTTDTYDGRDVAFYEYTWSGDGFALHTFDYLIVDGADLYLISLISTEEQYDLLFPYAIYMMYMFEIL
jgi:hypothetical protein